MVNIFTRRTQRNTQDPPSYRSAFNRITRSNKKKHKSQAKSYVETISKIYKELIDLRKKYAKTENADEKERLNIIYNEKVFPPLPIDAISKHITRLQRWNIVKTAIFWKTSIEKKPDMIFENKINSVFSYEQFKIDLDWLINPLSYRRHTVNDDSEEYDSNNSNRSEPPAQIPRRPYGTTRIEYPLPQNLPNSIGTGEPPAYSSLNISNGGTKYYKTKKYNNKKYKGKNKKYIKKYKGKNKNIY